MKNAHQKNTKMLIEGIYHEFPNGLRLGVAAFAIVLILASVGFGIFVLSMVIGFIGFFVGSFFDKRKKHDKYSLIRHTKYFLDTSKSILDTMVEKIKRFQK